MIENANKPFSTKASGRAFMPGALNDTQLSPFSMENIDAYQNWRTWKLDQYTAVTDNPRVSIKNPRALTLTERSGLLYRLRVTNMAVYECENAGEFSKQDLRSLAMQLGLNRLDGHRYADSDHIASIQASDESERQRYIPYTAKAINWHTDGYYNPPERTIRAFILHCVRPASTGGENSMLDPEMVYIHLRDRNPELLESLFDQKAMSVPANHKHGELIREQQCGPVFAIDCASGSLHMRYTARQTNIAWNTNNKSREALAALKEAIDECKQYIIQHRLRSGQGIVCNNVLHTRTAFENDDTAESNRLLYRARFYDRIIGTGLCEFEHHAA